MAGWKERFADLEGYLEHIVSWVSAAGQVILMAMVGLTVLDIILRRVFNQPLAASLELSQIMLVVVVFTSIAFCGVQRGHVRIDAVAARLPHRVQKILQVVTDFFSVVLFAAMGWGALVLALEKYHNHSITGMLPIPIYPFVLIVSLGSFLLALVLLVQLIKSLLAVVER